MLHCPWPSIIMLSFYIFFYCHNSLDQWLLLLYHSKLESQVIFCKLNIYIYKKRSITVKHKLLPLHQQHLCIQIAWLWRLVLTAAPLLLQGPSNVLFLIQFCHVKVTLSEGWEMPGRAAGAPSRHACFCMICKMWRCLSAP